MRIRSIISMVSLWKRIGQSSNSKKKGSEKMSSLALGPNFILDDIWCMYVCMYHGSINYLCMYVRMYACKYGTYPDDTSDNFQSAKNKYVCMYVYMYVCMHEYLY